MPHTLLMLLRRFPFSITRLLFLCLLFPGSILEAQEISAVWKASSGNWDNPSNWDTNPFYPDNDGVETYSARIDRGSVTLNRQITIDELMFGLGGSPTLQANSSLGFGGRTQLDVLSNFVLNRGTLKGKSTLNAFGKAIISGDSLLFGWDLRLSGRTQWSGRLSVGKASVIENLPGATIDLLGGASCSFYYVSGPYDPDNQKRTLNNYGAINARSNDVALLDIVLNSRGSINVDSGKLILTNGGEISGPVNLANDAILAFENTNLPTGPGTSGPNYVFTPTSSISGIGSVKFNSYSNPVTIGGTYDITGTTTVVQTVSFISPITSLGSALVVNGQFAMCDLGSNSVELNNLNLRMGRITGSGTITVAGPLEWNEGAMQGGGTIIAQNGVFFNGLTSGAFGTLDRTLYCYGSSWVQSSQPYYGNLNFGLHANLNVMPGAAFNGSGLAISGSSTGGINGGFTNYGTLVVDDPGRGMFVSGTAFINEGTIQITNSKLDPRREDGQPRFIQNAGSVQLRNGTLACDDGIINGGSLGGFGTVWGLASNGLIAPSGGVLTFYHLTLQSNSVLAYELNGTQPGISFGQVVTPSTAIIGGVLQVTLSTAFQSQVQPSDTFTILAAQSIAGHFTNVASGARLDTADGSGSFIVTYSGQQIILSNFLPAPPRGDSDGSTRLISPRR